MSSLTMQVTKRLETFLQGTKKLYIDGKFVPSASGATLTLQTRYRRNLDDAV